MIRMVPTAIRHWKMSFPFLAKWAPPSPSREVYRQALAFLVIALLAVQVAGIFYKFVVIGLMPPGPSRPVSAEKATTGVAPREPLTAYDPILERNLFGSVDKTGGGKSAGGPEHGTLSSLLELRGTVAGEGKYGFAVLVEKNTGKQLLVKIGGTISGATLQKVMRDRVILRHMGREEVLKRTGSPEVPVFGTERDVSPPAGNIRLSRQEITTALKDLGQVLSQARIQPHLTAGGADGFIIRQIRPGSIYQKMGLLDGDVLQYVDDRKIRAADDMVALFDTLRQASNITLTVRRSGVQEKIRCTLQ